MQAAGLLLWGMILGAEPNPYLAQAKVFYQGVDYENCLRRLEQAVRWNNTRQELVEIEIYWGLCQFEDGQRTAAKHFALALQLDPGAQLPPFTSPKVVEVFRTVAAKTPKPPPEDAPKVEPPKVVAVTEPPPRPEPPPAVVAPPPPSGRHLRPAPLALAAAAIVAGGATAFFGVSAQQNQAAANGAHFAIDGQNYANQAYFDATAANVAAVTAAVCAAAAVVVYFATGPKE